MLARRKPYRAVARIHRRTLRTIPSRSLVEAYRQIIDGYGESFACTTLGIDRSLVEGALRPALEEALWERGYFRGVPSPDARRGYLASRITRRNRPSRAAGAAR